MESDKLLAKCKGLLKNSQVKTTERTGPTFQVWDTLIWTDYYKETV